MRFTPSRLNGAFLIEPELRSDDRGYFARTMCLNELRDHGITLDFVQQNMSLSYKKGTMRGLHFQKPPAGETKLVRCTSGAVLDVIVDLRRGSDTFLEHETFQLSPDNHLQVLVPEGFAHAFFTLEDDTEVSYLASEYYTPGAEFGLRYNDPRLGIEWPIEVTSVTEKDLSWPDATDDSDFGY